MSTLLESILGKLEPFGLSYKNLSQTLDILTITYVSGNTWRITFTAPITGIVAGYYAYINFGANEGYHKITAVGGSTVDFDSATGIAEGAIGQALIYQIQEGRLTQNLNTIQAYVSKITGFTFSGTQYIDSEIHDGSGTTELMMDFRHIVSIQQITWLNLPNNILSIPVSAIEILPGMGILRVRAINLESFTLYAPVWPKGNSNIKVSYTVGFATMPDEVMNAITLLVASMILGEEAAYCGGGISLGLVNYSKTWGKRGKYTEVRDMWALEARSILRKYQTSVVGN